MGSSEDQQEAANGAAAPNGPHPSFIQLAKPYVFQLSLQQCMRDIGATPAKEDNIRLLGVAWIDNVRKALQLPVRTYNTACVYYHKFRLLHPDNEYDYRDAAAASLFNACKIEDTLKKSRDILCAAYNLRVPTSERLSSDDPLFETHSKTIVGLERLMLEASGFDFRNRYPQKMLMKLVKSCNLDQATAGMTAYKVCLDLYRTFAPLKQTTQTMALACLELAIRLREVDMSKVTTKYGFDYESWFVTREEIMETMLDVMDLYQEHRANTLIGQEYPLEKFISIRIELNREAAESRMPRYTEFSEVAAETPKDGKQANGMNGTNNGTSSKSSTISPQSPGSMASVGARGKEGTVRFMLDPARARDEKAQVKEFFGPPREIEEAIWVDVPEHVEKPSSSPPNDDRNITLPPGYHRDELLGSANNYADQPESARINLLQDLVTTHVPSPADIYSPPPADAFVASRDTPAPSTESQLHDLDPERRAELSMLMTAHRQEVDQKLQRMQKELEEKLSKHKERENQSKNEDKAEREPVSQSMDFMDPEQNAQAASRQSPTASTEHYPTLLHQADQMSARGAAACPSVDIERDAYGEISDYSVAGGQQQTSDESATPSLPGLDTPAPPPMPTYPASKTPTYAHQQSQAASGVPQDDRPPQAHSSQQLSPQLANAAPSLAAEEPALDLTSQLPLASTSQKRKRLYDRPSSPANTREESSGGPVVHNKRRAGRKHNKKRLKESQLSVDSSASNPASDHRSEPATDSYKPTPKAGNRKKANDRYRASNPATELSVATGANTAPIARSATKEVDSYRPGYDLGSEQNPIPLTISPLSSRDRPRADSPQSRQRSNPSTQVRNVHASAHENVHASTNEGPGFYIRGGASRLPLDPTPASAAERQQNPARKKNDQGRAQSQQDHTAYDTGRAAFAQAPGVDAGVSQHEHSPHPPANTDAQGGQRAVRTWSPIRGSRWQYVGPGSHGVGNRPGWRP